MTWDDKEREGVKKLEFWGEVIYGWSLYIRSRMTTRTLIFFHLGHFYFSQFCLFTMQQIELSQGGCPLTSMKATSYSD